MTTCPYSDEIIFSIMIKYFTLNDTLHCWTCIFSGIPFYVVSIVEQHNICLICMKKMT